MLFLLCCQALTLYLGSSGFSGDQADSADLVKNPTDAGGHISSLSVILCFLHCLGLFLSKQFVVKLKTSPHQEGNSLNPHPPLQLTLSALPLSIHQISWLSNIPCLSAHNLNMTLSIHLPFPSQINNSIGSSTHGFMSRLSFSSHLCFSVLSPVLLVTFFTVVFSSAFLFYPII